MTNANYTPRQVLKFMRAYSELYRDASAFTMDNLGLNVEQAGEFLKRIEDYKKNVPKEIRKNLPVSESKHTLRELEKMLKSS